MLKEDAADEEALTGDGGCVVGGVGPQVLRGVSGWLRQTLGAAAVTHAGSQTGRNRRILDFSGPPPKNPLLPSSRHH